MADITKINLKGTLLTIKDQYAYHNGDLATVATSGSYNDLEDKPDIAAAQVNSDWNATTGVAQILNKPDIPEDLGDLTNNAGYTKNTGTITGITMNGVSKGTSGVIDLGTVITAHQDISGKVGYSDDEWLQVKAGAMQAATAVPNTTTVNGKQLSNSIVIGMADIPGLLQAIANAGSGAVSVTTNQDGTFVIHVGETDYTINLNHTHENMARIVKCTTLPQTLDDDTIYVQVDSLTTPTEIQSLYLFGLEFVGGGEDTGLPTVTSPADGSTINVGENLGSGVRTTITIRAKNLSQDITVAVSGTGLSMDYNQLTGQTSITIAKNNAGAALASVDIVFTGVGGISNGSLTISSGNDTLSTATVIVTTELPNGYTRLEYIDNSARGIDTGILAVNSSDMSQSTIGSTWEVDVQCNSAPASNEMIVVANEDIGHWFGAVASTGCFGSGGTDYCFSSPATTRQQIQVAFFSNKIVLTSGGVTKTRNYTYHNNRSVCLLRNINPNSQQYAGLQFTGRVYSIRCTSGGSFDAVPAKRNSDNALGLYDKANGVFYPLN